MCEKVCGAERDWDLGCLGGADIARLQAPWSLGSGKLSEGSGCEGWYITGFVVVGVVLWFYGSELFVFAVGGVSGLRHDGMLSARMLVKSSTRNNASTVPHNIALIGDVVLDVTGNISAWNRHVRGPIAQKIESI